MSRQRVTAWQTRRVKAVLRWYLDHYFGRPEDPGTLAMFTSTARLGSFATSLEFIQRAEPAALFKLLIATACFQRLRDSIVVSILRSLSAGQVEELTSAETLLQLADQSPCPHCKSTASLRAECDLTKVRGSGTCAARPELACFLKRHTVWLRRYGHFGKVPVSAALALREAGAEDLNSLYRAAVAREGSREDRADYLVATLSRSWRISSKIAHMYLSMLTNPSYFPGKPPWQEDLAWERFVVADVNVDHALQAIGYEGPWTYDARAGFVRELAYRVDLRTLDARLPRYNPRLVQQALYVFWGVSNRKLLSGDCSHAGSRSCGDCAPVVRALCPSMRTSS